MVQVKTNREINGRFAVINLIYGDIVRRYLLLKEFPVNRVIKTERLEAMGERFIKRLGLKSALILQNLIALKAQQRHFKRNFRIVTDYYLPDVSMKIVRAIVSYIDYINRVVWLKRNMRNEKSCLYI